ncbi:IS66 family transposase [Antarcticibacterium flavum]|uniref:IS66 family transposase n=1 Tax=Antarcticibacterium flavum TaxID=2058175 RepID=A0A5B7X1S6_9FLAO|nr:MULTISPECIES: IS66 family transposase [Antarcticibacterium]MCM4161944.1 IS66 family transposase [Antarcticibacterium sp. W02-3]QCY68064.1 IS66 family transposase [Antarcticibacterium flavum]QCY69053.1 IS66 family transposase [Antarcticibacterium flavum]QCY69055.1 IS66 family transposase [Antarcticibacterium flavum]QCY70763.1 IS66 family transposase [Antarcticibacterium flavum]
MEKSLETLSKQQLLALLEEQSAQATFHKKELQKSQQELKQKTKELKQKDKELARADEHLRSYLSKSGVLEEKVAYLESQLEMFRRMQFGQKRERFEDKEQLALPFEVTAQELEKREEAFTEKITYQRKKKNATHKGRQPLPDHLPVEEVKIYPKGDISQMKCIGQEETDELEYEPARFFIRRYIRYKYAHKSGEGVIIGELPERVIDKGIPGSGLVTSLLVDKYCDHMPLHRQLERFKREKVPIPPSTMNGWCARGIDRIVPLFEELIADVKSQGYLQVDETTIKVQDEGKKGKTHLGYYWVYHSPIDGNVVFDYQPGRGQKAPEAMLKDFKGYLQTDGYAVYDHYAKKEEVTHLGCWAHARRYYEKSLDNDPERATRALKEIQKIYAIERKIKEANLSPEQIKEVRLKEALPVINELGKWMTQQLKFTLPKSLIGKALAYSVSRWDALCAYLYDGNLFIDNNQIEGKIRPVAVGRKNYLFAGSHKAAQRAAAIYSFFAICKKHQVNPYEWLKYTLENIMTIKYKDIKNLYPQNYKKLQLGK